MSTTLQHVPASTLVFADSGAEYAVEVRASGDFTLSRELLESVGASLMVVEQILSANLAAGTVDLRAAVRAPSRAAACSMAARALREAMLAAGACDVRLTTPRGWRQAIAARARRSALR
jgi:hypothetical protein